MSKPANKTARPVSRVANITSRQADAAVKRYLDRAKPYTASSTRRIKGDAA